MNIQKISRENIHTQYISAGKLDDETIKDLVDWNITRLQDTMWKEDNDGPPELKRCALALENLIANPGKPYGVKYESRT